MGQFKTNGHMTYLKEWVPDSILDGMLEAQGYIYADAQQAALESYGVRDTGRVISSVGVSPVKRLKKNGTRYITISPQGERRRGRITTRNAEIAFVSEYGKRGQPARPAIRTANERAAAEATAVAEEIYGEWINMMMQSNE